MQLVIWSVEEDNMVFCIGPYLSVFEKMKEKEINKQTKHGGWGYDLDLANHFFSVSEIY